MKFVGLLRGINVGGHGKLPMKSLITICESLGFQNVETYIQSGNVVFDASSTPDANQLSAAIAAEHGFAPKLIILEAEIFTQIADANPFAKDIDPDHHKFLQQCMFTQTPKNVDTDKIEARVADGEQWMLRENCFDLYTPAGIHNSKLAREIEKILGVPTTARNWKTILKLREMCRHKTKGGDGVT